MYTAKVVMDNQFRENIYKNVKSTRPLGQLVGQQGNFVVLLVVNLPQGIFACFAFLSLIKNLFLFYFGNTEHVDNRIAKAERFKNTNTKRRQI